LNVCICVCVCVSSPSMRREDLKLILALKLHMSDVAAMFVEQFNQYMKELAYETAAYESDVKIKEDKLWSVENIVNNETDDKNDENNNVETGMLIEPEIMYNATDGTLVSRIAIKSLKCSIYQWLYEQMILLAFVSLIIYWIGLNIYRRKKRQEKNSHAMGVKEDILLFLKSIRQNNPPFVPIEQAKVHVVGMKFPNSIWELVKEMVESDPNVQTSTRAVDGIQRLCWKISETAFLNH